MSIVVIDPHRRIRKPTPVHALIEQTVVGVRGLAARVDRWPPFMPAADDLAEAQRCAEGIVRLLNELAQATQGGPPDAA